METELFVAEALVDGLYYGTALIDHGSSSYAIVSQRFARRYRLACFPIKDRPITALGGVAGAFSEVCYSRLTSTVINRIESSPTFSQRPLTTSSSASPGFNTRAQFTSLLRIGSTSPRPALLSVE